jgi:hypothetical protein
MSEQGTTPSETRARLVQVLDEYLAAVQEGRQPDRDELRARHPDLADELQACLDSLDFIRRAAVKAGPCRTRGRTGRGRSTQKNAGRLPDHRRGRPRGDGDRL